MAVSSGYTVMFLAWGTGVCYETMTVSARTFLLSIDTNNDSQYCYSCLKTLSEAHYVYYLMKVNVLVSPSCLTLCDPMDCSLPGFSVHEILQARILGWVAISFSRASSPPRDWTHVSCIGRWILYRWDTREVLSAGCHIIEKWQKASILTSSIPRPGGCGQGISQHFGKTTWSQIQAL